METKKNIYQLSKTLRFGLTISDSNRKNKSHTLLGDLIKKSEENIKETLKKSRDTTENNFVASVESCVSFMKQFLGNWEKVYQRTDQLALAKDFYRQIARKARFDGFWIDSNNNKQPQSQIIKLSSLRGTKYEGKERSDYILGYWADNIKKTKQKLHDFELVLNQYKTAITDECKAHTKPNLVNFRKMFLSIANLINEILIPLTNDSICFPGLERLAESNRNKVVFDFVKQENRKAIRSLLDNIHELRTYFEENGGYVPYGKVTLNRHTAGQKPHRFRDEIEAELKKLGIIEVMNKLKDKKDEEIREYFEFRGINKQEAINNNSLSLVERVQLFKYKTIPVNVRFTLAEYLYKHHNLDKEKTLHIIEFIGQPVSMGESYKNATDKKDFDLSRFPLKPAFDYAWENLARYSKNSEAKNFPVEQCKTFLAKTFDVDLNNPSFKLYADLLFIKENLSTLEHEKNEPKDRERFIGNIKDVFRQITFPLGKDYKTHKETILRWIELDKEEQSNHKQNDTNDFEKAKQALGLLRGGQKNEVSDYKNLTGNFKDMAMYFGKSFADLRDKLNEENELNKIAYFGMIIEDENQDRYLLLVKLTENRENEIESLSKEDQQGEFKTFQIKSLTSKTLEKLIKNKGAYKEFHTSRNKVDYKNIKEKWATYKDNADFLNYLKDCLQNSGMAKSQNWAEFGFAFDGCSDYESIAREIDTKGHILKEGKFSEDMVKSLVENGCLLLPVVNQDITSTNRTLKNQFSKDWEMLFAKDNDYRLHPEFKISYRQPTADYPKEKRYSRFQMIAHLLCEFIPGTGDYISRKEQIRIFNDKDEQQKEVDRFNERFKPENNFYVIGIDRGLRQLATLCVLNKEGQIQGGFEIYTRNFNADKKEWQHLPLEKRNILDLSNLRVETTADGRKVIVDLESIKVKDEKGQYTKDNLQKIKLKQLAYIRKLQYQMQFNEEMVIRFIDQHTKAEAMEQNISKLITPYKEGERYSNLPIEQMTDMLNRFKKFVSEEDDKSRRELFELDAADGLKAGVVANMIGVIAFLLEKYNYNAFISLENLSRSFYPSRDGLSDYTLPRDMSFKEQENLALAGLGTYHFFEMQLLRKLLRIQKDKEIIHLVPAFRSVDNYETIRKLSKKNKDAEYTCKPFGIVHFVDPKYTTKKCAACDSSKVRREKKNNSDTVICNDCGFVSLWNDCTTDKNNEILNSKKRQDLNLCHIQNGDDNGAYHIALKTLANLKHTAKR